MSEGTAHLILILGAAVGAGVWFLGILYYKKMVSKPHQATTAGLTSTRTKRQAIETLLTLAAGQQEMKILETTDNQTRIKMPLAVLDVRFEETPFGLYVHTGADFTRTDRIFAYVMVSFVFFLTPLFVLGIPLLIWNYVIPGHSPAMRWQVFQVIQILHVLWPPFFVYYLHRRLRDAAEKFLVNLAVLFDAHSFADPAKASAMVH